MGCLQVQVIQRPVRQWHLRPAITREFLSHTTCTHPFQQTHEFHTWTPIRCQSLMQINAPSWHQGWELGSQCWAGMCHSGMEMHVFFFNVPKMQSSGLKNDGLHHRHPQPNIVASPSKFGSMREVIWSMTKFGIWTRRLTNSSSCVAGTSSRTATWNSAWHI